MNMDLVATTHRSNCLAEHEQTMITFKPYLVPWQKLICMFRQTQPRLAATKFIGMLLCYLCMYHSSNCLTKHKPMRTLIVFSTLVDS